MKVKAGAIGNGQVGNRQEGNSALFPIGFWLFTSQLPKTLYTPFFYWKKLGGEKEKNEHKNERQKQKR